MGMLNNIHSLELVRLEKWFFKSKKKGKLLEYAFEAGVIQFIYRSADITYLD